MLCMGYFALITKCVCMLEIGSLYVVWHADHEFLFFLKFNNGNLLLKTIFQHGFITKKHPDSDSARSPDSSSI